MVIFIVFNVSLYGLYKGLFKMKILIKLTFAIIVVLLLYAMLYNEESKATKKKTYSNNTDTVLMDVKTADRPKKNQSANNTIASENSQATIESEPVVVSEKSQPLDEELSYITAYRDWQYFANCYTDVQDFHNDKDPLETLAERFELNPRESQNEPTAQQNYYYERHVEICQSLIDDENDDYEIIRVKLKNRFESIIPTTKEEKQLEQALVMVKQLGIYQDQHAKNPYTTSDLSQVEKKHITSEIRRLTADLMNIYNGSEELTPEQTQIIKDYSNQIEALQLKLRNSEVVDKALMAKGEATVLNYMKNIDNYLHSVESPDAFLILSEVLYGADAFKTSAPIIDLLKQQTGIHDPFYRELLNDLVLPLVACSMNYPCDAESDIMMSFCLGLKDSMFNQACGLSLEDFYLNFYIGSNQLSDVNAYFNFIVNRYAQ